MISNATTQGIYINVPMADLGLLQELINRFGWQFETREQLLERFVKSCPKYPTLSEEDILNEVMAERYGK